MNEKDLEDADEIMRLAFGTFLGLPANVRFMGDADYVRTRYNADPSAALVAETGDGKIIGSNFALDWGSVGVFGPLTIHPDYWDKGVAKQLLEETMKIFRNWGSSHLGLFTFAQSSKHVHLYQKFSFWPRFLTAVMSANVEQPKGVDSAPNIENATSSAFSELSAQDKAASLLDCRNLTNAIYPGLDLKKEIGSVDRQKLGDTIMIRDAKSQLVGFAVCHSGPNTEAGGGVCYVKFGAVKRDGSSAKNFSHLVDACIEYARSRNASKLVAGANTARHGAYTHLIGRGFRTELQGVVMHSPNEPGYNLPDVYVIDDWR